jgi:hypothetical protein
MAVIVGELIAVIVGDVALFRLPLPPRAPELHHHRPSGRVDVQIGNPTLMMKLARNSGWLFSWMPAYAGMTSFPRKRESSPMSGGYALEKQGFTRV